MHNIYKYHKLLSSREHNIRDAASVAQWWWWWW